MPGSLARSIHLTTALVAIAVIAAASIQPLAAQTGTVVVQGAVTGSNGDTPSGAQIDASSRETGVARSVRADRNGTYRVLGLPPGVYDFTARALGYRPQRRERVRLVLGQRATLDFALERGATTLEPTVVRAEQSFEPQRVDIATPVLEEEIERLPLNTRNLLNLAAAAPGIRSFAPAAGRSIPAAGPLPGARFINLYVDGVEWKGMYVGNVVGQPGLGSLIPQEAVREFRVYLNPYDAEYTRGASWVISAVTHRGGNALQGSLFTFLESGAMGAKGTFQAAKPDFYRRQTGMNLRGPLVRDRLFFSLSYEGQNADSYIDVVPDRPAADPGAWDAYRGSFKAPLRLHNGLLRLTAPAGSHTLDGIWVTRHLTNQSSFGTRARGVLLSRPAGVFLSSRINSVELIDTYSASAFVNELSLHYLDNENDEFPLVPGPTLRYQSIQLGVNTFPLLISSRHFRAIDKTSFSFSGPGGRHLLRSGVEVSRVRTTTYLPSNRDGLFFFDTDTSTEPSRALVGMSMADPGSTLGARAPNAGWVVGAYLQDQWQPTSRLTVTAGARYDAEINTLGQDFIAPWSADTSLRSALGESYLNTGDRRNDLDNVAPRVAASLDLLGTGRTFARAGFGIMYDRVPVFGAMDERIAAGWRTYEVRNPASTNADTVRARIRAGAGGGPAIVLLKDRLQTPMSRQWSVGLGHQLAGSTVLNVDYLRQRITDTYVTINANWLDTSTHRHAITERFGDVLVWDDFGDATFEALLVSATYDRATTRISAAYTLAWSRAEFGALTTSDYPHRASYTMQRNEGDERHRVVLSGYTALPRGLTLSWMTIASSPRPFLVTVGRDVDHDNTTADDWPNGIRTLRPEGWRHWYRTLDLRLGRSFAMWGGRTTVSADVFNVLNTANHSEYRSNQRAPDYGAATGDYPRRQAQLGMRYQF